MFCPNCNQEGNYSEVHHTAGINDKGGLILKCLKCNVIFEQSNVENPTESRVTRGAFSILDTYFKDREVDDQKEVLSKYGLS